MATGQGRDTRGRFTTNKVVIHKDAVQKLAESDEVSKALQKEADRICAAANATLRHPVEDGYQVSSRTGRTSTQPGDRVYTATPHAMNSNAMYQTLLKVIDG